jgi:glucose dehydrogenase
MAGTSDNRLRALDSRTGKELWVTNRGATATTQAMTFQARNGKQYVAIAVGGAVHAFALP